MAQKFIGLEDAAKQLGVSKDRLTELREEGQLRGYRDGASWKFRTEDVDKLEEKGVHTSTESDIALPMIGDADGTIESLPEISFADVIDDAEGTSDSASERAAASDIGLEDLDEPTVPADLADDEAESVLLSETEFGDSEDRPPSTIIGKVDLDPTSDLELVLETEEESGTEDVPSDVRLAPADADVLSSDGGSQVADSGPEGSKSAFSDIEELELDLESESSRVLSGRTAADVNEPAPQKPTAGSDIGLAATGSDAGLTGISSLELEDEGGGGGGESSLAGISALELEEGSDVLGDSDGSDITLSSQDSGINLVSPSDSGLALDEVPIELGGSAIGSSLDLGDVDEVITLEPDEDEAAGGGDEDFLLTPITEEAAEEDEESSSQVIALDDVGEDEGAEALLGGEEDMFGADIGGGQLAGAGVATAAALTVDEPFATWTVVLMGSCVFLLGLCGMMMIDLVRNIWSWNGTTALNSGLLDAILGLFGG